MPAVAESAAFAGSREVVTVDDSDRCWEAPVGLSIREAEAKDFEGVLSVYREAGLDAEGSLSPEEAADNLKRMKEYPDYEAFG